MNADEDRKATVKQLMLVVSSKYYSMSKKFPCYLKASQSNMIKVIHIISKNNLQR